jgi:membrane protein YdbS with pleckstrin-like domain
VNKEIRYKINSIKYLLVTLVYKILKIAFAFALLKYFLYELEYLIICIDMKELVKVNEIINKIVIPITLFIFGFHSFSEYRYYKRSVFNITDTKINIDIIKLVTKDHYSFKYLNLQHIDLKQNIIEKFFKLKTIVAHTSSGDSSNLILKNIDENLADEYFLYLENEILK